MLDFLLPIALILVPVFAMVLLTVGRGRELSGSCGGLSPDGRCTKCGKPAAEMPGLGAGEKGLGLKESSLRDPALQGVGGEECR